MSKEQSCVWRDLFDPGWREREEERLARFLDAIPLRKRVECDECPTSGGCIGKCMKQAPAAQEGATTPTAQEGGAK